MKIAVITSGILPIPAVLGGAVENLIDYYLEFNEQHKLHDITVFSKWHPNVNTHKAITSIVNHYEYIDTHRLWFRLHAKIYGILHRDCYYFYQLEYFFKCVIQKISQNHYDLIILENRPGVAIKLSKRCKTPVVCHIHTNLLNKNTEKKYDIIHSTSKFIVVSNYVRQEIESIGIPASIQVIYNGINSQLFNKKNISPVSRREFGFKQKDFVAIYTGRIVPQKGVKELLKAFQKLIDYKDIKLLVVGGDNFGDSVKTNSFLEELHKMADGMDGKVMFTGFIPYDQLPNYLCLGNVAIVPSLINEALGMTCIEATAMGIPVIATNDGGIAETLQGQKHILLEKGHDLPQRIAEAVLKIKNDTIAYQGNLLNPVFTKERYAESFFNAIESYGS